MVKSKVALLGSGNWGSAIAKIIGQNVTKFKDEFEEEIKMYVYEEQIDGRPLTQIINTQHENVKYLPGKKLPVNIVADPDLINTAKDADILIWVVPHGFVEGMCDKLKGNLKPNVISLSLIKGFYERPGGGIALISKLINDSLHCPVSALMGANLANEVAEEQFCETTIGCANVSDGKILKKLFNTENFLVTVVSDRYTVEICGALKNIVACAAGFAEGLGLGDNTKAAVIRLGLKEMVRFCRRFYPEGFKEETFFESCGVADLVTTCYGGRNRKCAVAFVKTRKPLAEIEKELLNGQKLQGPATAHEVYNLLTQENETQNFPLFEAVHLISSQKIEPEELIARLRNQPDN